MYPVGTGFESPKRWRLLDHIPAEEPDFLVIPISQAREVAPQRWQAFFKKLFGIPKTTKFKEVTREIACKVFPEHTRFFSRKLDHGSADAALIAAYGLVVGIESAQS